MDRNCSDMPVRMIAFGEPKEMMWLGHKIPYILLGEEKGPPESMDLARYIKSEKEKYLIISGRIPKHYRKFFIIHAYLNTIFLADTPKKYLVALTIELAGVPEEIKKEYILFRIKFLKNLTMLLGKYYPDDKNWLLETEEMLAYLEKINRKEV